MTMLTIQLPDDVVTRLKASAAARRQALDTYVSEVLTEQVKPFNWLDENLSFADALSQYRALPSRRIQLPVRSFSALLTGTIIDPDFDASAWNREWARIEAEIKSADAADSQADQRRDGFSE